MELASGHVSPELVGFILTLALSLLIGFEREEMRSDRPSTFFGGVRTFPLIALTGYLLVVSFPSSPVPFAAGMLVIGALLALSHYASLGEARLGITTEVAALLAYGLGATSAVQAYWLSVAAAVVAVLLLHEKQSLEGLVQKIPRRELGTLVRFLLLTAVILPVVPNHVFTTLKINPFKIWLVVVAVSGLSYLSYLLQVTWKRGPGVMLAGILGGAYSSTAITVVLARQARRGGQLPRQLAGAILAATGMMYVRLWVLLMLFSRQLAEGLTALFWGLGLSAMATGALLAYHRSNREAAADAAEEAPRPSTNPLELTSAFTFAALFLLILIVTRVVATRFGGAGVLVLAGLMGPTDVDPFILGLTPAAGTAISLSIASLAVVIATATNNLMKGIYALSFGDPPTGRLSLALLVAWGAASIVLFLIV